MSIPKHGWGSKVCDVSGCGKAATRHCCVTLGSLPLNYDYCARHAVKVETELYTAGYRPVLTDIKENNESTNL